MELSTVRKGDRVMIVAKDDFFAYVDGWRGTVTGLNNGLVAVTTPGQALGKDGPSPLLTFFVPADQLALSV